MGLITIPKPLEKFAPDRRHRDGRQSHCRKCQRERYGDTAKAWREANPEKAKEYTRSYRQRNPEKDRENQRWNHIRRKFGLTREAYEEILQRQSGVCAICEGPPTENSRWPGPRFAVDHDHKTGRIRGLLCFGCNTALGNFGDDPELLRAALAYLGED